MNKPANTTTIVLILVGIILISGIFVPQAYMRYLNNREFRPPFEKGITKNIRILDDLRGITSLEEFGGSLWVTYCSTTAPDHQNTLLHEKMQALRARFPEETIKAAIFLVDVTIDHPEQLAAYRQANAAYLTEADYIIAGNAEVVHKYLRNEFRFEGIPYEKDGRWHYDQDLIILDRLPADESGKRPVLAHMRGQIDFHGAIAADRDAMKAHAKYVPHEERTNQLLVDTIQYLIVNPNEEDAPLSGEK